MYIVSIIDSFPDGNGLISVPKITLVDSIDFVRDALRSKYRETEDDVKRSLIADVIQQTTEGERSGGLSSGIHSIGFDIVNRDEWEVKKESEVRRTEAKISELKKFIKECKEKLEELDKSV